MSPYYVVAIPDETRIIVNIGKDNNPDPENNLLEREIEISEQGIELIDPKTNHSIGSYDPVKDRLTITNVYENYSIARKAVTRHESTFQSILSSPMLKTTKRTEYKELCVDTSEVSNTVLKSKIIHIGDLVKLI